MIIFLIKKQLEKWRQRKIVGKPESVEQVMAGQQSSLSSEFSSLHSSQLEDLRDQVREIEHHYMNQLSQLKKRVENLSSENYTLREELREWVCESCKEIFYGGSSLALRQVNCPHCNKGLCIPKKLYKIKELQNRITKLEASGQSNLLDIKKTA